MSSFFEKGTLLTGIQRQVLNLKFGNLLCSHPQLVGVQPWFAVVSFYVFIILKIYFRLTGVCAENLGIIFGTDSLTEIVLLRLLAGWQEEVNRFPLQFAI